MQQEGPSATVKSAPGIFFLKIPTNHACPVTEGTLVSLGLKEMSPEAEEMLLGCLTTGSPCYGACSHGREAGGSHMLASYLQEGPLVCQINHSWSSGLPWGMDFVAMCVSVAACLCT